jgi:hypothetical protein
MHAFKERFYKKKTLMFSDKSSVKHTKFSKNEKLNLSSMKKRLKLSICVEDETPTDTIRKYLQIYCILTLTYLRIFFARMFNK